MASSISLLIPTLSIFGICYSCNIDILNSICGLKLKKEESCCDSDSIDNNDDSDCDCKCDNCDCNNSDCKCGDCNCNSSDCKCENAGEGAAGILICILAIIVALALIVLVFFLIFLLSKISFSLFYKKGFKNRIFSMFVFLLINNISLCFACFLGAIVAFNSRDKSQILIFNSVIFAFSVFFSVLVVCFLKKIKKNQMIMNLSP